MLGSVSFPRPRMAVGLVQNLNFGLRGISSLISAPHPPTIASKSGFFYLFLALSSVLIVFPSASLLPSTNLYLIPSLLILGLSVVCRLSLRCLSGLISAKLSQFRKGLSSNNNNGGGLCAFCGSKMQSLKLKGCNSKGVNETDREKEVIKELRRKLRRERKKNREAMEELEREREASAWASEEAMAKIMLLQSEKALVEREARQYRGVAEQRQLHDKEVIEYLQLLIHTISMERGTEEESSGVLQDSCQMEMMRSGPSNLMDGEERSPFVFCGSLR